MAMETLEGVVTRVTFNKEDFSIGTLKPSSGGPEITYKGPFTSFPGELLNLEGYYRNHAEYGRQFEAKAFQKQLPRTPSKLKKLLGSGLIKGIGKVTAERMVDHFGDRLSDILEQAREMELLEVPGIGPSRADKIMKSWIKYRGKAQVMAFFLNSGFSLTMTKRIMRALEGDNGGKPIKNVQAFLLKNPYRLAWVNGVGWRRADMFARNLGVPLDDVRRVSAAILYTLLNPSAGHTYLPVDLLKAETGLKTELDLDDEHADVFVKALHDLEQDKHIKVAQEGIYHRFVYADEMKIAKGLTKLDKVKFLVDQDLKALVREYARETGVTPSDAQRKAIILGLNRGVSILTGGPGVGKTLTTGGIIYIAKKLDLNFMIAAPTGRAAKRITESTGNPAMTIHRMLKFQPTGEQSGMFVHNEDNPLDVDLLIIDEMSMVDTALMAALVKALPEGTRLVLTGDPDQLESVGPGNVLKDLIASNMFNITHLHQIFRQAKASKIVVNAQRINTGLGIQTDNAKDSDFHWLTDVTVNRVKRLVTRIQSKYKNVSLEDIQIVTPFRKRITDINITTLNEVMQDMVNANGQKLPITHCSIRVGDKVMQNVNNYEKGVFNGDIGFVTSLEPGYSGMEGYFNVKIDDREVPYHFRDHNELELAYAITAHKSQGGEYPYVIIALPPDRQADLMLRRNLLYTAVTRASKHCIVLGRPREVNKAIKNAKVAQRFTGLLPKLLEIKYKSFKKKGI